MVRPKLGIVPRLRGWAWRAGGPARAIVVGAIRLYQSTIGGALGGRCRFYPSCSEYAIEAVRGCGAIRGALLAAWRILRCSPLADGGVDHPPRRRRQLSSQYEAAIHRENGNASLRGRAA